MSSNSIDPDSIDAAATDSDGVVSLDDPPSDRDRDGIASLRDTEAEAGDEEEIADDFDVDVSESREIGADVDRLGGETPRLD
jgi:hypothetical protein